MHTAQAHVQNGFSYELLNKCRRQWKRNNCEIFFLRKKKQQQQ